MISRLFLIVYSRTNSLKIQILFVVYYSESQKENVRRTSQDAESLKKRVFSPNSGANIRRHLLKRAINKKSLSKDKSGDSTISSDENSDCCSEPINDNKDFVIDAYSGLNESDSKIFNVNDTTNPKESLNLDSTSFTIPTENLSGSLQNVYEIKSEVFWNSIQDLNVSEFI